MIIAGGVILFLCSQAELVLVVLLASVLIAFILAPVADFFERMKLPRSVASGMAMFLLLAALLGMSYVSYSEAMAFAHDLPKYLWRIRVQIAEWQASAQQLDGNASPTTAPNAGSVLGLNTPNWVELASRGFGSIYPALIAASFIPFLAYFMLSWHRHVRSATVMLFRMEHRHTAYVTLGLIGKMMRTFLVGNLLVGVFLSVASIGFFAMLHLPFFYFVGPISAFFSLVPYLGVVLALLPPFLVGFSQMDSASMMFVVAAVLVLHIVALNMLYPKYIGNRLQLNPLTVSMSLLFWGWLWGAMGLVLAIPLTATIKIVCDHIEVLRPYGAWMGE
ncbi:MAG TPA: AI-2E family transporter [Terriglobales bacterium]|nr:AI-2E family transporter [Terriglobales bacterium]